MKKGKNAEENNRESEKQQKILKKIHWKQIGLLIFTTIIKGTDSLNNKNFHTGFKIKFCITYQKFIKNTRTGY